MSFLKKLEKVQKNFIEGCELIVFKCVKINISVVSSINLHEGCRAILKTYKKDLSVISIFISKNVTQDFIIYTDILKSNFNRYYDV